MHSLTYTHRQKVTILSTQLIDMTDVYNSQNNMISYLKNELQDVRTQKENLETIHMSQQKQMEQLATELQEITKKRDELFQQTSLMSSVNDSPQTNKNTNNNNTTHKPRYIAQLFPKDLEKIKKLYSYAKTLEKQCHLLTKQNEKAKKKLTQLGRDIQNKQKQKHILMNDNQNKQNLMSVKTTIHSLQNEHRKITQQIINLKDFTNTPNQILIKILNLFLYCIEK